MTLSLDYQLLLRTDSFTCARHLMRVVRSHGEEEVSNQLLDAVEAEQLPPTIMPLWLSVVHTHGPIKDSLIQEHSAFTRQSAIKHVSKYLRGSGWHRLWEAFGGTLGLLSLFATLSVDHVRQLARAIGSSSKTAARSTQRQFAVTELFECLFSRFYLRATYRNPDNRPLEKCYLCVLPGCTDNAVTSALETLGHLPFGQIPAKRLISSHPALLQDLARKTLNGNFELDEELFRPLLAGMPGCHSNHPGYSASMLFAFSLISDIVHKDGDESKFPESVLAVLRTLLKKVIKHKAPRDSLKAITRLCVEYFESSSKRLEKLYFSDGLLLNMTQLWSTTGEKRFVDDLAALLQRLSDRASVKFENCEMYLRQARRLKRYDLLRMLCKEVMDINLEDDNSLLDQRFGRLSSGLFKLLQPTDAIGFLKRLMHMRPECDFVRVSDKNGVLQNPDLGARHTDCNMLLTYLHQGDQTARDLAHVAISERREQAEKEKDQPKRAFLSKSVISYATLSGSINVFKDKLNWARRFLRDHLTAREIYKGSVIANADAISLISGVPKSSDLGTGASAASISESVEAGNSALVLLFETVLEAHREPSFQTYHWYDLFETFALVVQMRSRRVSAVQKKLKLSNEETYNTFWSSTLTTLIDIEKRALAPQYEGLGQFSGPQGLLKGLTLPFARQPESTLQFMNSLGQARDEIWQAHRRSVHSSAAVLPKPFPRGLPMQCLVPDDFDHGQGGWNTAAGPFLEARAVGVVFMDPVDALAPVPDDDDIRAAIGAFVDKYTVALRVYVFGASTPSKQQDRLQSAYSHAVNRLCDRSVLSQREAENYLDKHFHDIIPKIRPPGARKNSPEMHDFPRLPLGNDGNDVLEWSPEADQAHQRKGTSLPSTRITNFFHATVPHSIAQGFECSDQRIIFPSKQNVWDLHPSNAYARLPRDVQDGVILSALLYLDSKKLGQTPEMRSPFPSGEKTRFPALYLDLTFLDSKLLDTRSALKVLGRLNHRVPSTLLAALCRTELDSIPDLEASSPQATISKNIALGLVRLLRSSDRPALALNLAMQVILDRPEASSWHRQMLTARFLRRLPASDAQDIIRSLVNKVLARLSEQSQRAKELNFDAKQNATTTKPPVKITTVKLIVQLLSNSKFVPLHFSIEVLESIFLHTKHVDIRAAVVETLLNMISAKELSPDLSERMFSALERAVPVIAEFNEAEPMSEEEWEVAERSNTVPQPFGRRPLHDIPPIMSALIMTEVPEPYRRPLVDRVFLRAMPLSQRNNRRWLKIVLQKHNANPALANLAGPFTPVVNARILNLYYEDLPVATYYEHHRWIMTNLTQEQPLLYLSNYFKNSHELNTLPEAHWWLELYHNSKDAAKGGTGRGIFQPRRLVYGSWLASKRSDGIALKQVQDMLVEQALAFLGWHDDAELSSMQRWMQLLKPRVSGGSDSNRDSLNDRKGWERNTRPVIERIVRHVDAIRTPEWQRDVNRRPRTLPDTFAWRLWLLPHPDLRTDVLDVSCCYEYAQGIEGMLEDVLTRCKTYHAQLQELKKSVMSARPQNQIHIALYLGSQQRLSESAKDSTLHVLCVEIAYETIKPQVHKITEHHVKDVADLGPKLWTMAGEWSNSVIEEVRVKGMLMAGSLPLQYKG
ncbi:MAG: hypothetical protein M1831_002783 [Alyxoria varia]|nr:MAG: hypothetical protein M1831_002783 [Alyxoria varia]